MVDAVQRSEELAHEELRSVAQLKMLHNLAPHLNRLNDVHAIGEAVTAELRTLIDYHNCRIYLLRSDGETLVPIVFRGELTEYQSETFQELITKVGEGITGHVAATGESFYTPNAMDVPWAVQIAGTPEVDESMLAVPLLYADRVIGVIVLSKLGIDRFDMGDMRLLEVLASHAAVALENARLFQLEREAAETASALLGISQALTGVHETEAVLREALAAIPNLIPCSAVAAYVRNEENGAFELVGHGGTDPARVRAFEQMRHVDPDTAARFLLSLEEPFVLPREMIREASVAVGFETEPRETLVAPMRWDPEGFGALVILASHQEASFTGRDVRLAGGVADITSLALGNARRFHELERFHELVEGLEAIFWEADAATLQLTFLSGGASDIFRQQVQAWLSEPRGWGDHIVAEDRQTALAALRSAVAGGGDESLEYRASTAGGIVWLRDMIHLVRDAQGSVVQLRGLMVDVTERKRAEQALRRSERKYSEAFRREREATQRLRALDEMKNTFLEAVSHDLRTPLTSILGSALTLEQAGPSIATDDAQDLVRRIAANARKLERLLSDLLDLDRLQRGIIAPQRRPTDVGALVRHVVQESDTALGRAVEIEAEALVASIDAAKVERILENLLANAARHTPTGTRLWVKALAQDGGLLLVVEDEGPGVPKELREAVFEPFRQGPNPSQHSPGVGVGLSLVGRFAELHGGRAWVEERPGGGASFRVFLPGS